IEQEEDKKELQDLLEWSIAEDIENNQESQPGRPSSQRLTYSENEVTEKDVIKHSLSLDDSSDENEEKDKLGEINEEKDKLWKEVFWNELLNDNDDKEIEDVKPTSAKSITSERSTG
ncbi:unnamed protein product, partial [Meganyctiphanes norvegica]